MRIVWLSANKFGLELLKEATKFSNEIVGIITLDDNAKTIMYDSVKISDWDIFNLPVICIKNINEDLALVATLKPDLIVMAGWRQILGEEFLNLPKEGVVGFHPTLLPKGRGPAPIINSIISGFKSSGITFFHIGKGLDDGDIIGQEHFEIDTNDYAMNVYDKCIMSGKKLIKIFLPLLAKNSAPRIKQDSSKATYFPKRTLSDNEIDLDTENMDDVYRKIRALSKPYKGAYLKVENKKLIIWKAELEK